MTVVLVKWGHRGRHQGSTCAEQKTKYLVVYAKENYFKRNQSCQSLGLGPLTSKTVRKCNFLFKPPHIPDCSILFWQDQKTNKVILSIFYGHFRHVSEGDVIWVSKWSEDQSSVWKKVRRKEKSLSALFLELRGPSSLLKCQNCKVSGFWDSRSSTNSPSSSSTSDLRLNITSLTSLVPRLLQLDWITVKV